MTLEFPAPCHPWSINQERQKHWSWRNEKVGLWRDAAFYAAKAAGIGPLERCEIRVTLPVRDNRKRDPHNYGGAVKAIVDGLVHAGLWPDDTAEWVTVAEPRLRKGGQVVVQLLVAE